MARGDGLSGRPAIFGDAYVPREWGHGGKSGIGDEENMPFLATIYGDFSVQRLLRRQATMISLMDMGVLEYYVELVEKPVILCRWVGSLIMERLKHEIYDIVEKTVSWWAGKKSTMKWRYENHEETKRSRYTIHRFTSK